MRRRLLPLAVVVPVALLAMCQSPTLITVTVTVDPDCTSVVSTTVTVGELGVIETNPPSSSSSACDGSARVASLVIVPSGAKDEIVAFKVVQGIGQSADRCVAPDYKGGCIVARRALHFIPHSNLDVRVPMRKSCVGIVCGTDQTCVRGQCVSATIDDPTRCQGGGGCDEGALGPAPAIDGGVDASGDGPVSDAPPNDASVDGDGGPPIDGGVCQGACISKIAAVNNATCAIVAGGGVKCWGGNGSDELGRGGTSGPDPTPLAVQQISGGAISLYANNYSTCAMMNDTTVWCWGQSDAFTTLLGTIPNDGVPVATKVTQMTGAIEVGVGGDTICWRDATGISCAGNNDFGQLGVGDKNAHANVTALTFPTSTVAQLGAGHSTMCALMADSTVYCWGSNSAGAADPTTAGTDVVRPTAIALATFGTPIEVRAATDYACARMMDQSVVCWGDNTFGKVGHFPPDNSGYGPTRVTRASDTMPLAGALALGLAGDHVCAIVANGRIECWGANDKAQLGLAVDAGGASSARADFVSTLSGVSRVVGGDGFSCALLANDQVWCWGANNGAQCGVDPATAMVEPVPRQVF